MFLPPELGLSIAETEGYPNASNEDAKKWAVSYCTKTQTYTPNNKLFPEGLILGAHYAQGSNFKQITGRFNASVMQIKLDGVPLKLNSGWVL
jgi:hypothetical protein